MEFVGEGILGGPRGVDERELVTEQWQVWRAWPPCPGCGRPRQTVCPACGTAGNQFPLAEYQALPNQPRDTRNPAASRGSSVSKESGAGAVLLMCPRCDEAFRPRFYRICPACGDDAGSGWEPPGSEREPIPPRVLVAVYGLLAVGVLMTLYFWLLFRGSG